MVERKEFKHQIGTQVMGVHDEIPVAGEIIRRSAYGNSIMYEINPNVHPVEHNGMNILEESNIIPFDGLKWKQAVTFWEEGNDLIERGNAKKKLAMSLLSEKSRRSK